jgi:hypothetical protein
MFTADGSQSTTRSSARSPMETNRIIAFKHRNGVISELMRIQFPMAFEDEIVAK